MIVLTSSVQIKLARLATLKAAVRCESVGLRHSSGRSMRRQACSELGLPLRTSYDDVIGALNKLLAEPNLLTEQAE